MKAKVKEFLKNIPLFNNVYQTIRAKWNNSPAAQMLIMHKVLKYNKLRFKRYSGAFADSKIKDTAYLTWLYHVVEKGLAMPKMKLGFGQEKVKELSSRLKNYSDKYGKDNVTYTAAVGTLQQYQIVHQEKQFKLPDEINKILHCFEDDVTNPEINGGGTPGKSFIKTKMLNFRFLLLVDIQ